jgi:hypothetical protein
MSSRTTPDALPTVTFEDWKERLKARKPVEDLALSGLTLVSGLVYGRVSIGNSDGFRVRLARFYVDGMDGCVSVARLEVPRNSPWREPQNPVTAHFLGSTTVTAGESLALGVHDPYEPSNSVLSMSEVDRITISPYAPGEENELPVRDLSSIDTASGNRAWAEYLTAVWPQEAA